MADERFTFEIGAIVIKRVDGTEFYSGGPHKWFGLSYADVVRLERMLHNLQGELVKWGEQAAEEKQGGGKK